MKTELIPAREVIAAIHGAFHGAGSCHCHTVAKLGEDEILTYLARRKLVAPADVIEIQSLSIVAITERYGGLVIPDSIAWALRRAKVRLLSDLTNWTYADVLRLDRMSRRSVDKLQEGMAQFGLLLKDGDPALLEHPPTPEPESEEPYSGPARNPEEIRSTCHQALTKLANHVLRDGTSLIRIAGRVGTGDKQAGVLRRYIGEHKQACAAEVAGTVMRLCRPLISRESRAPAARPPPDFCYAPNAARTTLPSVSTGTGFTVRFFFAPAFSVARGHQRLDVLEPRVGRYGFGFDQQRGDSRASSGNCCAPWDGFHDLVLSSASPLERHGTVWYKNHGCSLCLTRT